MESEAWPNFVLPAPMEMEPNYSSAPAPLREERAPSGIQEERRQPAAAYSRAPARHQPPPPEKDEEEEANSYDSDEASKASCFLRKC